MATLSNTKIKDTYQSLVKFNDNGNITTSPKRLTDGFGNASPFYVSTTQIGIGTSPNSSYDLHVYGNTKIGANLDVSGNLTVNGTLTYLNVTDLAVEDPLIKLAKDNDANILDIGLFGKYAVSTNVKYKGFFNDASDDKFKIFTGLTTEPTTTVDVSDSGYAVGTLVANVEGTLTGVIASSTTATTQNAGDNSTKVATTAYVDTATGNYLPLSGGTMTGDIAMGTNDISGGGTATFTTFTGNLTGNVTGNVTGNLTGNVTGDVTGGTISGTTGTFSDDVSIAISKKLKFGGGNHTYINEDIDDRLRFFTGGTEFMRFTEDTTNTVHLFEKTIVDDDLQINNNLSGTTATFTGLVTGIAPTSDLNFATKKYVDDNSGDAEVAKRIDVTVKNVSGGSLSKGVVVHAAPTATPPSGNVIEVIAADANDAAKMPAIGVLNETIADEAEGEAVMFGAVSGIDTSSFSVGDELYVSETAGEFTATKPTPFTSEVQKIAVVIKSHASNGLIKVFGAGRSNDIPNRVDRDMNFTDDSELTFGDSSDLKIYHTTNNIVRINSGDLIFNSFVTDGDIKFQLDNGAGSLTEYLRLDGGSEYIVASKNIGIGVNPISSLHLKYSGGSYAADSTSGFINQAETGRATQRIRSIDDEPAELFFDIDGGIAWDISARDSSSNYDLMFYGRGSTVGYNQVAGPYVRFHQTGNVTISGSMNVQGTSGSTFYGIDFQRSGSGVTTPDIWGNGNTLVLGHDSSTPVIKIDTTQTTFVGDAIFPTVQISNGQSYNENIRMFPSANNDYSSLILGAVSGTGGTGSGQWTLVRYPAANSNKFTIRHSSIDLQTFTTNGNSFFAERLGVGNTSPTARLSVFEPVGSGASRTTPVTVMHLGTSHPDVGYNGFGTSIVDYRRTYQESSSHAVNSIDFIERGNSNNDFGGAIDFNTKALSSGTVAPVRRMRIDYTGKIGINTTSIPGLLTIKGASTANNPMLRINCDQASSFIHSTETIASSMTSGQTVINVIGREGSSLNSAWMGYQFNGTNASTTNLLTFGHWGANHLMTIDGAGNTNIAGSLTNTGNYNFNGLLLNTYGGTGTHRLKNASVNGTVLTLTTTGDNRELYLQTDHIFSNGTFHLGDNTHNTKYRASTHIFENGAATFASSGTFGGNLTVNARGFFNSWWCLSVTNIINAKI
jgi:hypothetical protein